MTLEFPYDGIEESVLRRHVSPSDRHPCIRPPDFSLLSVAEVNLYARRHTATVTAPSARGAVRCNPQAMHSLENFIRYSQSSLWKERKNLAERSLWGKRATSYPDHSVQFPRVNGAQVFVYVRL